MTRTYCDECDVLLNAESECLSNIRMPQINRKVGADMYAFSLNHTTNGPRGISLCGGCVAKILREMADAHATCQKLKRSRAVKP